MDLNLGDLYRVWLYGALLNGSVTEADVDVSVRRVYRTHLLLGLLDPGTAVCSVHYTDLHSRSTVLAPCLDSDDPTGWIQSRDQGVVPDHDLVEASALLFLY